MFSFKLYGINVTKFLTFIMMFCLIQTSIAADYMENAERYIKKKQYSDAIFHLKAQLINDPEDVEARYLLGSLYLRIKSNRDAEKELGKAYKIKPQEASYRLDYAFSLLLNQKYEKVKTLLEGVVIDPAFDGDRLDILGAAYYAEKEYELAEHYYKQAVNKGNVKANFGLVKIALYNKNIKGADVLIDKVLNIYSNNIKALKLKAAVLTLLQHYQQALDIYSRLIKQNNQENLNELYLLQAEIFITLKRFSEAEKYIQHVIKTSNKMLYADYDGVKGDFDFIQKTDNLMIATDFSEKKVGFTMITKTDNALIAAYYLMARLYYEKKNYVQAVNFSQQVLNIRINNKPALFIFASAKFALNELNQAEKRYFEYLSLEPDNVPVHTLLADIYLAQNKADKAVSILDALPEKLKINTMVLKKLAIAYFFMGEFDKALESLRQVQNNSMENTEVQTLSKNIQMHGQEFYDVMQTLGAYTDDYKIKKKADYLQLLYYFHQKQFSKLKERLAQLIDITPNDPNLYVIKAKLELYNKNYDAALEMFHQALNYDNQHIPALSGLAKMAYNNKDYETSLFYFLKLIAIDKKNINAYLFLSILAEQEGDLPAAERYLQKAYEEDKGDVIAELKLAAYLINFFDKSQMHHKKELILSRLQKNYPDNLTVLSFIFEQKMKAEQYQQAEKTIRSMININTGDKRYYLLLAALLSKQPGHEEELFRLWDKAFNLDKKNQMVLIAKHDYQLRNKLYKEAILTVKQIKNNFPEQNLAEQMAGNTYLLSGQAVLALNSYEEAFQIQADAKLAIRIADVKIILGSVDDGIQFLRKQVENHRINLYDILFRLAELHQIKKYYHQAIGYYLQLLEQDPDNAVLLNNLAWNYMQINDPKAIITAEKAYKKLPDSAVCADTYGYILLKNFKTKKALMVLNKAVKLAPDNKDIQFHLAEAYYSMGDKNSSAVILKKIIQGKNSFSEKKSAQELLQQLNK